MQKSKTYKLAAGILAVITAVTPVASYAAEIPTLELESPAQASEEKFLFITLKNRGGSVVLNKNEDNQETVKLDYHDVKIDGTGKKEPRLFIDVYDKDGVLLSSNEADKNNNIYMYTSAENDIVTIDVISEPGYEILRFDKEGEVLDFTSPKQTFSYTTLMEEDAKFNISFRKEEDLTVAPDKEEKPEEDLTVAPDAGKETDTDSDLTVAPDGEETEDKSDTDSDLTVVPEKNIGERPEEETEETTEDTEKDLVIGAEDKSSEEINDTEDSEENTDDLIIGSDDATVDDESDETTEEETEDTTESDVDEAVDDDLIITDGTEEVTDNADDNKETEDDSILIDENKTSGIFSRYEEDIYTLDFAQFETARLVVLADNPDDIIDKEHIIANYGSIYLLQYESVEQSMSAYLYYADFAEGAEPDTAIEVAGEEIEGTTPTENTDITVTADVNPLAILADTDNTNIAVSDGKIVALIDTGVSDGINIVDRVSIIDEDVEGTNPHGNHMANSMITQNPDIQILSIRAMGDDGRGTISSIIAGMEYAMEQNVDIINLSIYAKSNLSNSVLLTEITKAVEKGIEVVAAAGNDGADVIDYTPGCSDEAWVIGASDEDGVRLLGSNYGETVDYNVIANTTSEAAAKFSGYISKYGLTDLPVNTGGLIFYPDYDGSDVDDEDLAVLPIQPGEQPEVPDEDEYDEEEEEIWEIEPYPMYASNKNREERIWKRDTEFDFDAYCSSSYERDEVIVERDKDYGNTDIEFVDGANIELRYKYTLASTPDYHWYEYVTFHVIGERDYITQGSEGIYDIFPDFVNQERNEGYSGIVPGRRGEIVEGLTYTALLNDTEFEVEGILIDYNPYTFKVNRVISDGGFDITKVGSYKIVYEMSHFMYSEYTWILESTINVVDPASLEAGVYLTSKESTLMFRRASDGLYGGYGNLVKLEEGDSDFILSCIDEDYEVGMVSSDESVTPEEISTILDQEDNTKLLSITPPSVDDVVVLSVLRPGYKSQKMFTGGGWQTPELPESDLNKISSKNFALYEDAVSGESEDDEYMYVADSWTAIASKSFATALKSCDVTGENLDTHTPCTNKGDVLAADKATQVVDWVKSQGYEIKKTDIKNIRINCQSGHKYKGIPANSWFDCTFKATISKNQDGKVMLTLTGSFWYASGYQYYSGSNFVSLDYPMAEVTIKKRIMHPEFAKWSGVIDKLNTTFTIYSNKSCSDDSIVQTMTIAAEDDGTVASGHAELPKGTYYIRETYRVKGCTINGDVYKFTVDWGQKVNLADVAEGDMIKGAYIINKPYLFTGLIATKIDADTKEGLGGATFKVEFSLRGGDAFKTIGTWYLVSNKYGRFFFDESYLSKDPKYKSDPMPTITGGRAALPLGWIQVTEVEAPKGYELDPKPYRRSIDDASPTESDAILNKPLNVKNTTNEDKWRVRVNVKKVNKSLEGLAGAEFEVYDNEECTGKPLAELISGSNGISNIEMIDNISWSKDKITFWCKEIKAPDGYAIIDTKFPLTFERSAFEALSAADKKNGELKTFGPKEGIINEDGWKIRMHLKKTDDNGKPLAGAEFGIYLDEKCEGSPVGTLKSNADGSSEILSLTIPMDKLSITVYCKETKAPDGYALSEEIKSLTFTKEEYDKLLKAGDDSGQLQDFGTYINKEGWKVRVQLKKIDENGKNLAGAVFDVYDDKDCTHSVGQLTSGNDGMTNILTVAVDMNKDSIELYCKETSAPNGYQLLNSVELLKFEKEDYLKEVSKGNLEGQLKMFGPASGIVNTIETTPTPTPPTPESGGAGLLIKKTSTVDPEILELHSYSIAGAEFSVTPSRTDGSSGTLVTREDGTTDTLPLRDNHETKTIPAVYNPDGSLKEPEKIVPVSVTTTYTVRETKAPKGHKLNMKEEKRDVTMSDDAGKTFEVHFEDEPYFCKNKLDIQKLGVKGEPIKGAVFKVEFFDSPSGPNGKPVKTWYLESDGNGRIALDDAHISRRLDFSSDSFFLHKGQIVIPIDCYMQFTEVMAPAEYEIDIEPFGMTTAENDSLSRTVKTGNPVYNDQELCEIKIKKYEDDGKTPIAGVEFELTFLEETIKPTSNKNQYFQRLLKVGESIIFSTDANGEIVFPNLDHGKYRITEVKTHPGHTLLKDPIEVTVPMQMSAEEAEEYGNVDFDSSKHDISYTDKFFFYSCLFEITNHAQLKMPMTGGLGTWKYGFIGMGIIAMISTGLVVQNTRKKRKICKKKKRNVNDFKI